MGRGFSLRDINKMTEEEAGIYFDKVPGFENLKKQRVGTHGFQDWDPDTGSHGGWPHS